MSIYTHPFLNAYRFYSDPKTVPLLPRRLHISVRDFEVALDEAVGMNPKNFFRQYRAVMARRLIQEGRNLHEIADDLGFRHYSHFSTEMKGFYGIAPLRLKKLVEKRCGTMNPA
ncbi:AraC family transcriptional regulator [bacterium]|jgi:AraC-like DNA-binding protein|nr:AraC family transcriptional regulator [bacterium]